MALRQNEADTLLWYHETKECSNENNLNLFITSRNCSIKIGVKPKSMGKYAAEKLPRGTSWQWNE